MPAAETVAAAPAAESAATDLVLEVVVSGEGDKAVFRLAEGATKEQAADAVVAFCSAHVGEKDLEQCTTALSQVRAAGGRRPTGGPHVCAHSSPGRA